MDTLHSQYRQQEASLRNLQEDVQTLLLKSADSLFSKEHTEHRAAMLSLLDALKLGLVHNIRATQTMLAAVHEARQGQLHPGLITSEQFEPILRKIQDTLKDVNFPFQGPCVSADELIQISTITIVCEDHQLKILVDVPLLEKYNYQAFKLHPLSILQESIDNGTGRA